MAIGWILFFNYQHANEDKSLTYYEHSEHARATLTPVWGSEFTIKGAKL